MISLYCEESVYRNGLSVVIVRGGMEILILALFGLRPKFFKEAMDRLNGDLPMSMY